MNLLLETDEWIAWVAVLVSSGILAVLSRYLIKYLKAKTNIEWIDTLDMVIGMVINEAESWAKKLSTKSDGAAKHQHAIVQAIAVLKRAGAPTHMKTDQFVSAAIESKLAGGTLAEIAESVLVKKKAPAKKKTTPKK